MFAFGDSSLDVSMLDAADVGIVPEHSRLKGGYGRVSSGSSGPLEVLQIIQKYLR